VKREQFPALILVQEFEEGVDVKAGTREANLRVLILTDSKKEYVAAERYTYTIKPILYPLEELFLKCLGRSVEVGGYGVDYTRIDHVRWGAEAGDGTASNVFNDFIDAVELLNLKVKILKIC
jgi:hypothetical protein